MPPNTKENILQAAIRVFAQKGYKGATVREIGQAAGAANLSAVTYHFKGKENLYRAVLEFMFQDTQRHMPEEKICPETLSPEEMLEIFILTYMKVIYVMDTRLDTDLAAVFSKEITHPSPFFTEMVETYIAPGMGDLHEILKQIIGREVPQEVILDCQDSIMGQIYYHLIAWSLISRVHPDRAPAHTRIEAAARHIFTFTMGGLRAVQQKNH